MTENINSSRNNEQWISDTWVHGFPASEHSRPGEFFKTKYMFKRDAIVGSIYIVTDSGNIYYINSDGKMENMRNIVRDRKIDPIALSNETLGQGKIVIGEPFSYEGVDSEGAVHGNISRVSRFILVSDHPMRRIKEGFNWRPDHYGKSDFEVLSPFLELRQQVLDQSNQEA